eukprot:CAMPEP_0174867612 /NCGR_PEP_ID=MMETSP1114-20130205/64349_1 /TAXON_ID=312471 /ORGANISM="Neobodo designis, Strain CCAP 1951/1" /LENGTH=69 /DNA_ID=CAMNT_0016102809 /DNA_START=46 /DNA_END=251 /DNA_ORIENTATION=+
MADPGDGRRHAGNAAAANGASALPIALGDTAAASSALVVEIGSSGTCQKPASRPIPGGRFSKSTSTFPS